MPVNDLKYWHLHNHQLFKQLSDQEIANLCIITRFKEAKKGDIIFFSGDVADRIFILKKGAVKIIQEDEAGNEVLKDIIHEGDLFGHLPGFQHQKAKNEYAQAASEQVIICTFTKEDFESVLSQNPGVTLKFVTHIGDKMRTLEHKYNNLVFKDVKSRLLDFLTHYVKEFAMPARPNAAKNHLTQEDIAQLIGSSRQSVAGLIAELEREGVLKYSRSIIELLS